MDLPVVVHWNSEYEISVTTLFTLKGGRIYMDTCVFLMVKYPEPRQVKARLAKSVHQSIATELYRNFVLDTLTTLKQSNLPFVIAYHPANILPKFHRWLGNKHEYMPQKGKDLGERLQNGFTDLFSKEGAVLHVRLGLEADAVCVAPATADFIARAAHGLADDLLATTLLATRAPVVLCPAMNDRMFAHAQTQANLLHVREELGYRIAGPGSGPDRCSPGWVPR